MPVRVSLALLLAAVALFVPTTAEALTSLERGVLAEGQLRYAGTPEERSAALRAAAGAGVTIIRVDAAWRDIAPAGTSKPAGFDAADPNDPLYRWSELDRTLREVSEAGFEPLVNVTF